jgi:formiminotetrahydrofolate cyclodeaminase
MTAVRPGLSSLAGGLALAQPVPGAGAVAAGVVALAAGICEAIARSSLDSWDGATGATVQAATIRARADDQAAVNELTYEAARAALATVATPGQTGRDATLRAALIAAAEALLEIADSGADCAALAAEVSSHCEPALRPDAGCAAEFALAGARAAAALIDANLALLPGDERRERARLIVAVALAQRDRALAGT